MNILEDILKPLICERFLREERYRNGHIHILAPKPGTIILGVHTPEMKKAARELALSSDSGKILDGLQSQLAEQGSQSLSHEERMVWGLMIDCVKAPLEERLNRIDKFLPAIDNWAICDNFCCNAKWIEKEDKEKVWKHIDSLFGTSRSSKDYEFTVRAAAIISMCHFIDENNLPRTFARIRSLDLKENEPYYIRMGIAWLLATSLAKNPDPTRKFAASSSLPRDIIKLYVRKACESRITKNTSPMPVQGQA